MKVAYSKYRKEIEVIARCADCEFCKMVVEDLGSQPVAAVCNNSDFAVLIKNPEHFCDEFKLKTTNKS